MRPACDQQRAIETYGQKVALTVFIRCRCRTLGNMQHLLLSNWLKVKQLCFVNTVLHRGLFVHFCFYPRHCSPLSCRVRGVTMNSKAGRFCLSKFAPCIYDAFYSLKFWQKQSPIVWELREPVCLATVLPLEECSRGLDARLLLSILSSFLLVKAFNIPFMSLM